MGDMYCRWYRAQQKLRKIWLKISSVFWSNLLSETVFQLRELMCEGKEENHSFFSYIYNTLNVALMFHIPHCHKAKSMFQWRRWYFLPGPSTTPSISFGVLHIPVMCQTRYIYNVSCCIWSNDDIMTWKRFPYYMNFIRGIQWSP